MPEDLRQLRSGERVRLDRCDDRAGDVLVQVGAADPGPARGDDDLGRLEPVRLGDILDPEVSCGVEAKRFHSGPLFV